MEDIKQKLAELERRLELLERERASVREATGRKSTSAENRTSSLIRAEVSEKRFAPANSNLGEFEDHIWFTVTYSPDALEKPTRAVKGVLNFTDLFGESKFRINITVNEKLEPGRVLVQEGIGFTYNQFLPEHQWLLGSNEEDVLTEFIVTHVLYVDGTSEKFA